MSTTLTVYKASAGSGKTFTLAVEYMKLLIHNPRAYEGILAVTFTNKATEEMKMRILSQLYGLWKGLPGSRSYMGVLKADLHMEETVIAERAHEALSLLLHNYHYFRVQTIDTFFQGVLRNLAHELQLSANLRVGLNNKQVVEQAVDDVVDSLADNKALLHIVTQYMRNRLNDGKSWNIIKDIKRFGGAIFNEKYKRNRKKMEAAFTNPEFFHEYSSKLHDIITENREKLTRLGNEALQKLDEKGINIESFAYGKNGVMGYFLKLANGIFTDNSMWGKRMEDCSENPDKWVTKKTQRRDIVIQFVEDYLRPRLNEIERERRSAARQAISAQLTLERLNEVRLLKHIEDSAHLLNEASQRFMLSDTQTLLHDIIADDDSPFIFEKIGAHLQHIMIDEFQDTSIVQWANFKTLLRECMGQGFGNLIVGDVKQSIYRFRSGDWRLLNSIENEFREGELAFQPKTTNYRSLRNVITFNNAFFTHAAKIEEENIRKHSEDCARALAKAYADVEQQIPDGKPAEGYVQVEMLPKKMLDDMNQRTLDIILSLLEQGAHQRDIAILVRGKKEIASIAAYIEEKNRENDCKVDIISAEAFRLDASRAVCAVVNAMRHLANPKESIAYASLQKFCTKDEIINNFEAHTDRLLQMPLHDMAEELARILHINELTDEGAYLSAFFDQLDSFSNDMAPVLEDFLTAWDDELCEHTIETADSNGVRIMTIHKSKGLEFDHVIMPYCNWTNEKNPTTLWVEPKEDPFSKLPLVPLEYRNVKKFTNSIYEDDAIEEHVQNIVDDLNLLYVAMTRAGRSLFIIGEQGVNDTAFNRSAAIEQTINALPKTIGDITLEREENEEGMLCVKYGEISTRQRSETSNNTTSDNVFEPVVESIPVAVCSYESKAEYRQSNESRQFAEDAEDDNDRQRYIRMGTVMHQLFSTIRTLDDVKPAIQRMEFDGMLFNGEFTREELYDTLRKKFSNPQVKAWFAPKWKVYDECTIITHNGEQRPDRVICNNKETIVIDFKFGKPHDSHKEQVRQYCNLLREMQMQNVTGYLWYVNKDEITEVK